MSSDQTVTIPPSAPAEAVPHQSVIADRFTIESLMGRGGMGSVYRAIDSRTGQHVALKLLHALTETKAAHRFQREARLLSELRHPAIVSYVAHGLTEGRQSYLAMEWLEGEDLARRLSHKPLRLQETLALLRRTADALAAAHRQGIVHRDIKPSNLLLRGNRPEDVVLLDFGLARHTAPTLAEVTNSNMVLGTPGYMAPEQASSQLDITTSADIFSLGCVLYECLTGTPPFAAPHFTAALSKILFAEPPPLKAVRDDLPPSLQPLLDRMLDKDPRRRLPDATALLDALSALGEVPDLPPPRPPRPERSSKLDGGTQQLVSLLLVSFPAHLAQPADSGRGAYLRDSARAELAPYGARVEQLADGALVATVLAEHGTATDQAALAARCALALKKCWPQARVVLVTGRGMLDKRLPVGEAMDRAGRLLRHLEQLLGPTQVMLDEVTAGLLGPDFQLTRLDSGVFQLQGDRISIDASRPLLGKATPCVGREQELTVLELAFTTCVEEQVAQALLVTAPAGVGKSRLLHEFLRRLEQRHSPVLVLKGRGSPLSARSAYAVLGQAVRKLCGPQPGEDLETRRQQLAQRLTRHLPAEHAQEVVEFLGEMCGIPFPDEASPRLRAARSDPHLMRTQVSRALMSFLRAECQRAPVLLVLDDLHWGDTLSVRLVEHVLRELAEHPILVLAMARPEVKEAFPWLWANRLQELPLHGLNPRASARLVREVLGPQVPDAVVGRLIEQATGNTLFLEELIRMVAEGRGEEPPETVLAILQSRLLKLEKEARRVLLAGSLFGRTFWAGGVRTLLQVPPPELAHQLERLQQLEVIEHQPDSRYPGEEEYRFRHSLVRDAAYGLVPEKYKRLGNRVAGTWREQRNEPDPLVLAEHFQQGHLPERALPCYLRAAEQLFESSDLEGALRCVEAAQACGASGEDLARLRSLQALVAFWRNDFERLYALGPPALEELRAGSRPWCRLMDGLITTSTFLGRPEKTAALNGLLLRTTPAPDAVTRYVEALTSVYFSTLWQCAPGLESILARLMEVAGPWLERDAVVRGWVYKARSSQLFDSHPWQAFMLAEQSLEAFREAGADRNALGAMATVGLAQAALGDRQAAVELLQAGLDLGQRTQNQFATAYAHIILNLVLANSPEQAPRERTFESAMQWASTPDGNVLRQGVARYALARVWAGRGELAEAEAHARESFELLTTMKAYQFLACATLSELLLAQGRAAEARDVAAQGLVDLERMGGCYLLSAGALHLALAEACFAHGDVPAGEAVLRQALRGLHLRASGLPGPATRERFLHQVPENARLLALARLRWGEAETA
jgi:serine/threonine protein kinase/tetratricopeptide (TPR) repeat protein